LVFQRADRCESPNALARLAYSNAPGQIPLCVLAGEATPECWQGQEAITRGDFQGIDYACSGPVCFASLHIGTSNSDCADDANAAYQRLFALAKHLEYPHLLRVWHYLSDLNLGTGDQERYKQFCLGRARALDDCNITQARLPAATLVGSDTPGLRMHVLLVRDAPVMLENPRQISAFKYPREYGPRQPAFARAAIMPWRGSSNTPQLFVSGTASIVGHRSQHEGQLEAQIDESLANIDVLLQAAHADMGPLSLQDVDLLKVYLRHPEDSPRAQAHLQPLIQTGVSVVILHAQLCRQELLVELETQVTSLQPK